jgi:glycosyltransferase involved in cell wall biosynthesis
MASELILNGKYLLSPLKNIYKDDINSALSKGTGIYICSFPDQYWHDVYNFKVDKNYSIQKKTKVFNCLNESSILLSPTEISKEVSTNITIKKNRVVHLSSIFKYTRLKQIEYTIKILFFVYKNKSKIDFVLYYNFEMPIFFTSLIFKYILCKKIYVDFEDDYSLIERNKYIDKLSNYLYKIPDLVICINNEMVRHFGNNAKCLVFNGFADLDYAKNLDFTFRENTSFLFAGTLDTIRGADLLISIVDGLKQEIKNFKIFVCGTGPLKSDIENLNIPEIDYLGFLTESQYLDILEKSDCFLVLQKPDHPFNKGSYPSKIEYYAQFKKPIYSLTEIFL